MRPLSAEDTAILSLENETVAGHACKLIVLGERIDPERLRSSLASRLERAPELTMLLRDAGGAPCWVAGEEPDMDAHVVADDASAPLDRAGLRSAVARVFEQRLERSRPLWRIDVIPALAEGGSALIWRIHHALADGSTAMRIAREALWDGPRDPTRPGAPDAGAGKRLSAAAAAPAEAVRHDAGERRSRLAALARETPRPWRSSPFDGRIGGQRSVAFAAVELSDLRQVAAATRGATVNDAVLALVAGGLRRWLEAHHGRLGAVRVKVPVSLHASIDTRSQAGDVGNRDSFFCLDLPIGQPGPLERLGAIRAATRVRKESHDAQRIDELTRELGEASPRLKRFADRALVHPRSFALNVSNVPGPRTEVHVDGIRVTALYSVAEIRERHALRVAVVSLADTLGFGLCADPTLLADVEVLAAGIEAEAGALLDCVIRV